MICLGSRKKWPCACCARALPLNYAHTFHKESEFLPFHIMCPSLFCGERKKCLFITGKALMTEQRNNFILRVVWWISEFIGVTYWGYTHYSNITAQPAGSSSRAQSLRSWKWLLTAFYNLGEGPWESYSSLSFLYLPSFISILPYELLVLSPGGGMFHSRGNILIN